MKGMSFILAGCFLFQSLVFGSGWFCGILAGEIKLCECNHSSQKEKHADSEDSQFETKLADSNDHQSHKSGSLPDCHSAKSGETHKCACKKAKDKAAFLSGTICTQFFFSLKSQDFYPNLIQSPLFNPILQINGVDITMDLERPPQFS